MTDFANLPLRDTDPLDAVPLQGAATFPGLVVKVRAAGVLRVGQHEAGKDDVRNDRVIAVPVQAEREARLADAGELSAEIKEQLRLRQEG